MSNTQRLNWRDYPSGGSVAHASRAVGGRYSISRNEGYNYLTGPTGEIWFTVNYRDRDRHDHYLYSKPPLRALEEAKRFAEQDHVKRKKALHDARLGEASRS